MKNLTFNKILILLLVCLISGGILPYLLMKFSIKLFLLVGVLFLFVCLLILKRGRITVYDWLILYFIGISFNDFRITFGSFFLRLTEVFFIPYLIWVVIQITRDIQEQKKIFKLHLEYLILLFFLAFSVISALFSADYFLGISRTIQLSYLILLSFTIFKIFKDEKKVFFIIKAMIAVSAGACVFAILQSFLASFQPYVPIVLVKLGPLTIYRSGVGWQNPNYFAFYISMILPITYVCKISRLFPEKRFLNICFILQLLGLISTYSRSCFISLGLAFVFLLCVRGKRKLALILVTSSAVFVITAFMSMSYIYEHNPYLAATLFRIVDKNVVKNNPLLIAGWRRDAWIANTRMFLDHPILGIGPFMSTSMYSAYSPDDQAYPLREGLAVHSEYLSLLSERGLVGASLFLLFLFVLMIRAKLYYNSNKNSALGRLMLGLWSTIMNFIFFAVGAAAIYSIQFWINVGLIIAVYNLARQKTIEDNN